MEQRRRSGLSDSRRLVSLDALRGFDMFWIWGVVVLAALLGLALAHYGETWLQHLILQGS